MGEQISDRYNPSRQLKVNEDGSIDVYNNTYTTRLAYNSEGRMEYTGHALPGINSQAASWRIKKTIYTNTRQTHIIFCDGNSNFDNVWSDRTTLKYGYQGTKIFTVDVVLA